jgi:hypothetical protein
MNIELLKRLRKRFLLMRHPEHFDMRAVAAKTHCGSVMCIAGHTLQLAGYKMKLVPEYQRSDDIWMGRTDYDFISPSGRTVEPLETAAKELGLEYGDRDSEGFRLFHDFELASPKQAAARIQELIESAEVSK